MIGRRAQHESLVALICTCLFAAQVEAQVVQSTLRSSITPSPGLPGDAYVTEFVSASSGWLAAAQDPAGYAFDTFVPGTLGLTQVLTGPSAMFDLGTTTLEVADISGVAALFDGTSYAGQMSDALLGLGSLWQFSPPVYGLATYYASFQAGCSVRMALYSQGNLVAQLARTSGGDSIASYGHGFLSDTPIDRILFSRDCADMMAVGAYVNLALGETSLGTVDIPGYVGPQGSTVELDFAITMTPTPAPCLSMVSLPAAGQAAPCTSCGPGDCASRNPSTNADGRFIAFRSSSDILVAGDDNCLQDVFVRDRDPDGNGTLDDTTGITTLVSSAWDASGATFGAGAQTPVLSANGTWVAFTSNSHDLTPPGVDTNGVSDIFARDWSGVAPQTTLISVSTAGVQGTSGSAGPALSADGRYVAFNSTSVNLVAGVLPPWDNIFLHDRDSDGDGIFDEPGAIETILVTDGPNGTGGNGHSRGATLSADGRFVAFWSDASDLVGNDGNGERDAFVFDRDVDKNGIFDESGQTHTERVSAAVVPGGGDGTSDDPQISADGCHAVFWSVASNLVLGDTNARRDVFVYDMQAGSTVRVSVGSGGTQAQNGAPPPTAIVARRPAAISGTGRFVAFTSDSVGLVDGLIPATPQVFVHDRDADEDGIYDEPDAGSTATFVASVTPDGQPAGKEVFTPFLDDGGSCLLLSTSTDLLPTLANNTIDVFSVDVACVRP